MRLELLNCQSLSGSNDIVLEGRDEGVVVAREVSASGERKWIVSGI